MSTVEHDAPWWQRPGWLARAGPVVVGAIQVVGSFGASQGQPERRDLDALAVVLLLAGPAALLFLRRFPMATLAVVTPVTLGYLLAGYPYGPVVLSLVVALVGNVLLGHRLAAWVAAGVVTVGHVALRGLLAGDDWSWAQLLGVGAWAALVLVIADVGRARLDRVQAARRAQAEQRRREAGEERLRIARELHDVVAHHMSLINVQAGVALHLVDRRPEQAQTALAAIKDASHEALSELRSLVGVLRDEERAAPRAPASMLGSLEDLVERTGHAGLAVEHEIDGTVRPLPAALELAAVRIVQEAVTNVVRHSGARRARIRIGYRADVLVLQVDDDGTGGARADTIEAGSGIRGMRERADALGGTLRVGASPLGGVRVETALPLEADG